MEHKDHFELLDDLQIHYLELPKLPKKEIEELDKVELWLEFFGEAGKEESEERIKKIKERSMIMETAINKLQEISADERMREIYRAREKARLDMVSKIKYAENRGKREGIQEGIQEGRQEGRREGRREVAKKLLDIGLHLEQIEETTGLTMSEIEELKRELSN